MAIDTEISDVRPSSYFGIVTKFNITSTGETSLEPDTYPALGLGCSGSLADLCNFKHKVLADASDSTDFKNDKSSFIQASIGSGASVTFTIQKDGVDWQTITDNTYGTYSALGTMANVNYAGFVLNWRSVLNAVGGGIGCYKVKIDYTFLGVSVTTYSPCYDLMNYNSYNAEGTVKFRWRQSGKIKSSFYDFSDFSSGWDQYLRIDGEFGRPQIVYEETNITRGDYTQDQVQDQTFYEYNFETMVVNAYIRDLFGKDLMLADDIKITDYNFYNPDQEILNKRVRVVEAENIDYFSRSRLLAFKIKFGDRRENTIKRLKF
jgi:hypothetical protein